MRFDISSVSLILVLSTLIQIAHAYGWSGENILAQSESNRFKKQRSIDTLTQTPALITVKPQIQGTKVRTKPNKNDDAFRQTYNFPEVEYPTVATPRSPFHLQEANNLHENLMQRAQEYSTSTTAKYPISSNKKDMHKMKYTVPALSRTTNKPDVFITISGFGATPKPFCFREEGAFPDVEYPLEAKDTWNPNYWKPIPGAISKNDISNKNDAESISKFSQKVKSDVGSSSKISQISSKKLGSNKDDNKKKQASYSASAKKYQLNNQYNQVTKKEDLEKKDFVNTDDHTSTTIPPNKSVNTKSTTPFVLTPYTTLYFDTTSQLETNPEDENKSTTPYPKTRGEKRKKKKSKKKDKSKNKVKNEETSFTSSPLTTPMPKFQVDNNNEAEDLELSHNTTPLLPEKILLTTQYELTMSSDEPATKINSSSSDTCPVSDPVSSVYVITTIPPYLNSDVTPPMNNVDERHNDEKCVEMTSDENDALLPNPTNKTHCYKDNKDSSCFDYTVVSSNKSSICHDKTVDSLSLPHGEVNVLSLDEEFSTDVPDFDENSMFSFPVSTSTVSPLGLIESIDEAWGNSRVIDPHTSLTYSDELEQYYIMVP